MFAADVWFVGIGGDPRVGRPSPEIVEGAVNNAVSRLGGSETRGSQVVLGYPLASSTPMEPPDARDNSPKPALTPASERTLLPPGKTTPSGPWEKRSLPRGDLPLDFAPAHQMTA